MDKAEKYRSVLISVCAYLRDIAESDPPDDSSWREWVERTRDHAEQGKAVGWEWLDKLAKED